MRPVHTRVNIKIARQEFLKNLAFGIAATAPQETELTSFGIGETVETYEFLEQIDKIIYLFIAYFYIDFVRDVPLLKIYLHRPLPKNLSTPKSFLGCEIRIFPPLSE